MSRTFNKSFILLTTAVLVVSGFFVATPAFAAVTKPTPVPTPASALTPTTTPETQPAPVPEAQPAGLTAQTGLPPGVGTASLAESIGKFITNPYIIIVVVIVVLLLIALWLYDKFYSKKKKQ